MTAGMICSILYQFIWHVRDWCGQSAVYFWLRMLIHYAYLTSPPTPSTLSAALPKRNMTWERASLLLARALLEVSVPGEVLHDR